MAGMSGGCRDMSGKADYRDASRIEHMYAALSAGVAKADFVEGNSFVIIVW